jgi:hypothetical protein
MSKKSPHTTPRKYNPSKTDEQICDDIVAALTQHGALSRMKIILLVSAGLPRVREALVTLEVEERIECFTSKVKVNGGTFVFYCLPGQRPKAAVPSGSFRVAETLAGFRQAIQRARDAGNDPFKVNYA